MNHSVKSIISYGPSGILVDIECHLSNSLPNIVIVGAANKTVDEAKERIRGAFSNAGLQIPRKRISINLAPADIPKESSSLDLPIAIAIIAASQDLVAPPQETDAIIGELGLDGTIRPVRGIIGKLIGGRRQGITRFYVPFGNLQQARVIPDVEVIPVKHLRDLYRHFDGRDVIRSVHTGNGLTAAPTTADGILTMDDITGQQQAKRALEIAVAGGHNVLLNGPPGTGKSMLAKALASLLPDMSREEMLEVTHLHSLISHEYDKLITNRPVRTPHHSTSHVAVVGGGNNVRPGEVSLAHRGILYFDELPEFDRQTIEALRQPLEDRQITVSRAKESVSYPANFIFVATANPCPCGYAGTSRGRECECSMASLNAYRRKLSGPLLDRIDIRIDVDRVEHDKLLATPVNNSNQPDNTSTQIKRRVLEARIRQARRFGNRSQLNSDMTNRDIREHCQLDEETKAALDSAAKRLKLSARAYMRTLKLARTIADLAGSQDVCNDHISEALQFREQPVAPVARPAARNHTPIKLDFSHQRRQPAS